MVNIKGLDKAAVLKALYDGARPQGMGHLNGGTLTLEDARELIEFQPGGQRFDYVLGRPIKCDISGDEFDPWGYDRDAGQGAAERVIAGIR